MSQPDAIPEFLLAQARAGDGAAWASSSSCIATICA